MKKLKQASQPGDTALRPLPTSPSGSLSPGPGPFSPPLLASLLITLAPSHISDPPGPTHSPSSDPNRCTHVLMSPPTVPLWRCGRLARTVLSLNRSVAHASLAHALEHKTWDRHGGLGKNRGPVWGGWESTGGRSGFGAGFGDCQEYKVSLLFLHGDKSMRNVPRLLSHLCAFLRLSHSSRRWSC